MTSSCSSCSHHGADGRSLPQGVCLRTVDTVRRPDHGGAVGAVEFVHTGDSASHSAAPARKAVMPDSTADLATGA